MIVLAVIRRRQKRWTPRLSAFLAVVWVGMLWQPCASAMDMDGHAGHAGHAEHAQHAEHHCPHCPPQAHNDCETVTEECASLDRFDADRRTAKFNFGAGADDVPQVPIAYWSSLRPLPRPTVSARAEDCGSLPQGPPLNILFCVYLS